MSENEYTHRQFWKVSPIVEIRKYQEMYEIISRKIADEIERCKHDVHEKIANKEISGLPRK